MRISHKLMLLAVMAIAATTMSAAPASAHVEVTDEATATHCDIVVTCTLTAADEAGTVITAHTLAGTEIVTFICTYTFNATIGEDGEGQLTNQKFMGAGCPNKPCNATGQETGNGTAWPIHIREVGEGSGLFELHTVFCQEPAAGGGPGRSCEITPMIVDDETHDYEFLAVDEVCGGTPPPAGVRSIEVDTHWNITSGSIEINHGA